eukprot:TRINITY_DN77_c0_g1_i1.p3 TRINITY_DN77_c0_g1~~TRINITY_DN77_c0_g1_i1.p3  ORF type:complete len:67 (+),score=7.03 TRINITY_DN77_c0_g1_i1:156-356(+)
MARSCTIAWTEAGKSHSGTCGEMYSPGLPKIWIKAALLEKEPDNKRAVLRRALEFIQTPWNYGKKQ